MSKKNLMPIVVLVLICVIVAAVLAGGNAITAPEIEEKKIIKIKESLDTVMPEGSFGSESDPLKDAPDTVKAVYTDTNGKGHVVVLETNKGYTGKPIGITVAIGTDGRIIKAVVTENGESIVPPELKANGSYGDKYTGKNADESLDLVTGVTVKFTESAIKNALYDAFEYLGYAQDRVLLGAYDVIPGAETFEEVKLKDTDGAVKRMLVETSGKGKVLYIHTYAQYGGGLETETLIAVNEENVITGIKNLNWTVGHNENSNPPAPSKEKVDAFFKGFVGKSLEDIETVELVTNATGTATNVRVAVTEALEMLEKKPNYLYRVLGISVISLLIEGFVIALIFARRRRAPYEK